MPVFLGNKEQKLEGYSKAYIGATLIYEEEAENVGIEFLTCPFPAEWTKTDSGYSATNEYGEWKISATDTGSGNASRAFDLSETNYWQSPELTSSTDSEYLTIECPVLINPKTIYIVSGSNNSSSTVQGYSGSSWKTLGNLTASSSNTLTNRKETTLNISAEQFYSKFRIMVRRYNSSNNEPRIYEFQIKEGVIMPS